MDIGKFIDEMHEVRAEKRYHEAEIKRIDASIKLMESQLFTEMECHGLTESQGKLGKAEIKLVLYPHMENWDDFYADIRENNNFSLLHKRISLTKYRELVEAEQDPSGTRRNFVNEITLRSI